MKAELRFSKEIRPIQTTAPWFKLGDAAKESGVSAATIKEAGIPIRRFGRADYAKTSALNAWITGAQP